MVNPIIKGGVSSKEIKQKLAEWSNPNTQPQLRQGSEQDPFKNGKNEQNASATEQSSTSQLPAQEQLQRLASLQQLAKQSSNNQLQEEFKKHQEDCDELQKMVDNLPKAQIQDDKLFIQLFTSANIILTAYKQYKQQKEQDNSEVSTVPGNQIIQKQKDATQSVAKNGSWWDKWKWKIAKIAGTISVAGMVGYLYNQYNQGGNINNNAANLKRDEKEKLKTTAIINKQEYNFYTELINANSEMQKKNLVELTALAEHKTKNTIPPHNRQNGAINKEKEAGKVALIAEKNHSVDHKTNVQMLVEKMEKGEMGAGTVVALERKEGGEHLGMRDVRLLAEVMKYNEGHEEKIKLPAGIEETALLWDAKLVNEAQKHGVQVVGVEGKCLAHGQQSPEYNADREDYMARQLTKLKQ